MVTLLTLGCSLGERIGEHWEAATAPEGSAPIIIKPAETSVEAVVDTLFPEILTAVAATGWGGLIIDFIRRRKQAKRLTQVEAANSAMVIGIEDLRDTNPRFKKAWKTAVGGALECTAISKVEFDKMIAEKKGEADGEA